MRAVFAAWLCVGLAGAAASGDAARSTRPAGACSTTYPTFADATLVPRWAPSRCDSFVNHGTRIYMIFYRPPGAPAFDAGYRRAMTTFLGDVAHDSDTDTNSFSVAAQYFNVCRTSGSACIEGRARYTVAVAGSFLASDALPSGAGCRSVGYRTCATPAQLAREAVDLAGGHGLAGAGFDYHTLFLMFLAPDVAVCPGHGISDCNSGYHGWSPASGAGPGELAVIPYPDHGAGRTTGTAKALAAAGVTSHEVIESMTDPTGLGWGGNYGEIADTCSTSVSFAEVINAHSYDLPAEWSNAADACATSVSAAEFQAVPDGERVWLSGASSSQRRARWSFGDGTTLSGPWSTMATVAHAYRAAGSYKVELTVTDAHGVTTSSSRWVSAPAPRA